MAQTNVHKILGTEYLYKILHYRTEKCSAHSQQKGTWVVINQIPLELRLKLLKCYNMTCKKKKDNPSRNTVH